MTSEAHPVALVDCFTDCPPIVPLASNSTASRRSRSSTIAYLRNIASVPFLQSKSPVSLLPCTGRDPANSECGCSGVVRRNQPDVCSLPGLPVEHRRWVHLLKGPSTTAGGICKLAGSSLEPQISLDVVEACLLEVQVPFKPASQRGAAHEVERESPVGESNEWSSEGVPGPGFQTMAPLEGERSAWGSLAGPSDGARGPGQRPPVASSHTVAGNVASKGSRPFAPSSAHPHVISDTITTRLNIEIRGRIYLLVAERLNVRL